MLAVQEESLSDGTDVDGQGEVPQTVLQVLTLQTSSQVRVFVCVCTNVYVRVCTHLCMCVCEKFKIASHQSEEKFANQLYFKRYTTVHKI